MIGQLMNFKIVVAHSVMSKSLQPHGLSFTVSWRLLKLTSIESVMPSNHFILCHPLLLLSIFPSIRVFFQWVHSSNQVAKVLEFQLHSVLPMNSQGWFPLGLTGWIFLLSKGLSRVFSSTTFWKHQFFGSQPSLLSNSYWKNHSFDSVDLCRQNDVSAF